jgi:DNA-binding response OmpR family regulator
MLDKIVKLATGDELDLGPKQEPAAKPPAPKDASSKHRLDAIRVLIVDEAATARCALMGMVKKLGGEPQAVADGDEAVALANQHRFDVLVVDLDLGDGVNLIRTMRMRNDWGAFVPIIGLTSEESSVTNYSARSAGAHHVAVKPMAGPTGFARMILSVLSRAQRNAIEAFGDGDLAGRLAKTYGDDLAGEMLHQTQKDLDKGAELLRDAMRRKDREQMHHAGRFLAGVGRMLQADEFASTALRLKQYNPALVDDTPMRVLELCEAASQALSAEAARMAAT